MFYFQDIIEKLKAGNLFNLYSEQFHNITLLMLKCFEKNVSKKVIRQILHIWQSILITDDVEIKSHAVYSNVQQL